MKENPWNQPMEDYLPMELEGSRNSFLRTATKESNKSGTNHIIYHQAFLNYDLVIQKIPSGMRDYRAPFNVKIKPVAWAAAFNQRDIESTTRCLWKAIVHSECRRIIIADRIARSNIVKLFEHAVSFMMAKFQPTSHVNPWSFPSSFDEIVRQVPYPDDDLTFIVRAVLREFDPRHDQDAPARSNMGMIVIDNIDTDSTNGGFWDEDESSEASAEFIDNSKMELHYEDIFKKMVNKNSELVTELRLDTAQIAAALTRRTICQDTNQIVDTIQFRDDIWKEAFKSCSESIGRVAAKLSGSIVRLPFLNETDPADVEMMGSPGWLGSIFPTEMLAIYRASKFIHNRKTIALGYEEMFDSQIPEHNEYPTIRECEDIDKEILLSLRNIPSGLHHVQIGLPEAFRSTWLYRRDRSLLYPGEDFLEEIPSSKGKEYLHRRFGHIAKPSNSPKPRTVSRKHEESYTFTVKKLQLDKNLLDVYKHKENVNGIEPILLKELAKDSTCVSLNIEIRWGESKQNRIHAFSVATWNTAKKVYSKNGPIRMGTNLLHAIFEVDELRNYTPSGRKSAFTSGKLDENRQWQIIDVIHYFLAHGVCFDPWTPDLEKKIRKAVITEGTHAIRAELKRNKDGQSTYQNLQDYPLVTPMDTSSDISTFDTKEPTNFSDHEKPEDDDMIDVIKFDQDVKNWGTRLHHKINRLQNHIISQARTRKGQVVSELAFVEPSINKETEAYVNDIVEYLNCSREEPDIFHKLLGSLDRFALETSKFEVSDRYIMNKLAESDVSCYLSNKDGREKAQIVIRWKKE
ncbi:uncharacterized protein LOC110859061 isoform X2 [Folsomia candida]|uniref:uncharacterized protein LOC110859061 isoform X2 n=1 Tax=Folsomia candida TaxID=158441 RepID=UPI001604C692|nr:uncharacterized protein LOC110859061 isoform X2 [Folsomia candida]